MGLTYIEYPKDLTKEKFYSIMGEFFAEPKHRKELPYLVNKPGYVWRLYFQNNHFVAFIHYCEKPDNFIEIGGLYVLNEYRNQGFATKIIKELDEHFKEYNQRSVTNNPTVINIREKLGFTVQGMRGSYKVLEKRVEEKQ